MPSFSSTVSLYHPATGWSGFVPEFLNLMSADLTFAYNIVDQHSVCSVELVEAFRAFLRNPRDLTCSTFVATEYYSCCVTAAKYYRDDKYLFSFDPTVDLTNDVSNNHNCPGWMIKPNETSLRLDYENGFPYVYDRDVNGDCKRGDVFLASLILWPGIGENVRSTPPIPGDRNVVDLYMASTALPLTPIFAEPVRPILAALAVRMSLWIAL
jgi:hypothetical protein